MRPANQALTRLTSAIVASMLIVPLLLAGGPVAQAGAGGNDVYLALGDSLSVGYQPGRGETAKGYVDDLSRRVQEQIPALTLRNVGCAGESSRSMITGEDSPCSYTAGSQLDAAVAFLQAHPGQVAFITIDIGANDVINRCLDFDTGLIRRTCVANLLPALRTRLTQIVDALEAEAGPGVPILAMNYYNPFLGFWGLVPGGRALARADQRAWAVLNEGLATGYGNAGATVVDVAKTFRIDDFEHTVFVKGRGRIPVNVALACRWTWFCSRKHFGDPHANRIGYRRIAHTFYRELTTMLP